MDCSKCGRKMGVANTAGQGSNRIYLLDKIAPFVDWYTSEFVARDRRCYVCKQAMLTVEMNVEDLIGALRYAQIDSPCLTQSIIDWSIHIRETAKTFRDDFQPTRPPKENTPDQRSEVKGEGTLARKGEIRKKER